MRPREAIHVLKNMDLPRDSCTRPRLEAAVKVAIAALKEQDPTCGSCHAGILMMHDIAEDAGDPQHVEACDTCKLFATDADASAAVESLLKLLHRVYRARYYRDANTDDCVDTSVAGAMDYIIDRVGE